MLVPAAILVLLALAAIAVDGAIVLGAQRDLAHRTASLAGDLANAAVDDDALYGRGSVVLDPLAAAAYTSTVFAPDEVPPGYLSWEATTRTDGRRVTVTASAEVRHLFSPAAPGARRVTTVRATSSAEASG